MHKKLCFILSFLTLTLLQPSLNQPATGGLTVSFQSENICIDYDETCGHLTMCGKTNKLHVCKTLARKCRKMHQSCGKQTGLYGKISTVDKIDNNALKMYQTSTSFLPTLTFARSFHGILWQVFVHLHSFTVLQHFSSFCMYNNSLLHSWDVYSLVTGTSTTVGL